MTAFKVTVTISNQDFIHLSTSRMGWSAHNWRDHPFETYDHAGEINWGFKYAYFFDTAANLILARSYLEALEPEHQVLSNESVNGGWVIITDYDYNEEK
jgi:hypothetical protein